MSRRVELDALRGFLLVTMAVSHLPTRLNGYADQPFGFVSTAEAFVFLSAFVTSSASSALMRRRGAAEVRRRLWSRAAGLYGWHLALLLFLFTVGAGIALLGRPALKGLLTFYFESPGWSLLSAPLLIYQPPLLDILPMYVVFLAATPWILQESRTHGWTRLLFLSFLIWAFAQLGGRALLHEALRQYFAWPLPLEAFGAFDWFAWQLMWMGGLWIGDRASTTSEAQKGTGTHKRWIVAACAAAAAVFLLWRHGIGGVPLGNAAMLLDKWQLGAIRVLNFVALGIVVAHVLLPAMAKMRSGVLALIGQASLPAFVAHLVVCILSLGLIADERAPLTVGQEAAVLLAAFAAMLLAAWKSAGAEEKRTLLRARPT